MHNGITPLAHLAKFQLVPVEGGDITDTGHLEPLAHLIPRRADGGPCHKECWFYGYHQDDRPCSFETSCQLLRDE